MSLAKLCALPLALLLAWVPAARSQGAPQPDDAAVTERLQQIEASLDKGELYANLWWNGWIGIFTGYALVSGTISVGASGTDIPVWRISALRASLGTLSVVLLPIPAVEGPPMLRLMPDKTPKERLAKLRAAEDILHRAAKEERLNRSWVAHSTILVSVAFSIWIWRGYHRPGAALTSLATGVAATEAKIFTSPTHAIDDEARFFEGTPPKTWMEKASFDWSLAPTPNGMVLAGRF